MVFAVFLLSPRSSAMQEDSKTSTFETPGGGITTTTKTVQPTPQKVTMASPRDIRALDAFAARAESFVAAYLSERTNPSLEECDQAFRLWQQERRPRFSERQVVEILGARLGNQLIADLQMEWVVVKDKFGTDYAVRAKKHEVMSFPFSSVAKRIERNQHDFMAGVYYAVAHTIASGDYKPR